MFLMLNPHMPLHTANIAVAAVGLSIRGRFTQLARVAIYKKPHCGRFKIVRV